MRKEDGEMAQHAGSRLLSSVCLDVCALCGPESLHSWVLLWWELGTTCEPTGWALRVAIPMSCRYCSDEPFSRSYKGFTAMALHVSQPIWHSLLSKSPVSSGSGALQTWHILLSPGSK